MCRHFQLPAVTPRATPNPPRGSSRSYLGFASVTPCSQNPARMTAGSVRQGGNLMRVPSSPRLNPPFDGGRTGRQFSGAIFGNTGTGSVSHHRGRYVAILVSSRGGGRWDRATHQRRAKIATENLHGHRHVGSGTRGGTSNPLPSMAKSTLPVRSAVRDAAQSSMRHLMMVDLNLARAVPAALPQISPQCACRIG
jgi:hypothetical protein